jgi:putative protease
MTELLSPAGSLKNMRYAFAYGADAVYAGQPRYSLRVRNNEFDHEHLQIGINEAHALGKKFYVVVNIQPHNPKLKTFIRDLAPVVAMQPDALIISDPGLIMLVREHFPQMAIHLSVQANAVNWATVKFWQKFGISRVILSRELSLEEIAEIRAQVPEIELEVFVHGALCMAYSGRCLLSGYMHKRDANQGACTNACRWDYQVHAAEENETGEVVLAQPVLLQQGKHTALIEMDEDQHGSYIMNSKDLRAVQHVKQLIDLGIHSLKIEGRTKSYFYCARTAQVYRQAIDDAQQGKAFDGSLMARLEGLAHRGYTEGFLRRHVHSEYQNYQNGSSQSHHQQFVGEVLRREHDYICVAVKNKFLLGDRLELMTPEGNHVFVLQDMLDQQDRPIDTAKGDGHVVKIPIDPNINVAYGLVLRFLTEAAYRMTTESA